MNQLAILAIGGAHIDRRGRMTSPFVPGASIPGMMREDVGGGAFNALRSAVQLGPAGAMMSVRGGDAAGEAVARALALGGIEDLGAIFLDRATPSYTALLDSAGDVVAALADMQLYEIALPRQLRRSKARQAVAGADAILTDANVPAAGLRQLASLAAGKPLFAIAISPAKVVRLAEVLPALSCLFMNQREAAALAGADAARSLNGIVGSLREMGLSRGVITRGSLPAVAFDQSLAVTVAPPAPRRILDVTGAGDALAGVMMVALLGGTPLGEALRHGVAAATLAVEEAASVPDLSKAALGQMLALVPPAQHMR